MERTVTAIDGSTVTLESPTLDLSSPGPSSAAAFLGATGNYFGLQVGRLSFGDSAAEANDIVLTEQYTLTNGGTVRVGSVEDPVRGQDWTVRLHVGVWKGTSNSAISPFYMSTSTSVVTRFNNFIFTEHPTGLEASHQTATIVRNEHLFPTVMLHVPGMGLAEVFRRSTEGPDSGGNEWQVPPSGGMNVYGGKLYVEQSDNEAPDQTNESPEYVLLLVTPSALVRIYGDRTELSESQILAGASNLAAGWA